MEMNFGVGVRCECLLQSLPLFLLFNGVWILRNELFLGLAR